jgi:hypothetical protein
VDELIKEIIDRYQKVVWFTYRKDMVPIGGLTTDAGWGCMIRTGQMMVHEALRRLKNHDCIELFLDNPSAKYSIHNIC